MHLYRFSWILSAQLHQAQTEEVPLPSLDQDFSTRSVTPILFAFYNSWSQPCNSSSQLRPLISFLSSTWQRLFWSSQLRPMMKTLLLIMSRWMCTFHLRHALIASVTGSFFGPSSEIFFFLPPLSTLINFFLPPSLFPWKLLHLWDLK